MRAMAKAHTTKTCARGVSGCGGARYFERQGGAVCGLHALSNIFGGPQFLADNMVVACNQVLAEVVSDDVEEHVKRGGRYSHSVLARVLQNTVPPSVRLLAGLVRAVLGRALIGRELCRRAGESTEH